ncbi:YgaP family membrane protein [Bacillus testis]|uniref:YgaP family membrane protein n=1 Tax=Bacillus testis TaxID=1622072 RepID=UPI00067E9981|nr:DUF2892 domain-containing protein [Bacillus testis]
MKPTATRVERSSQDYINDEIQEEIERRIDFYKTKDKKEILDRISQLDKEWDTERVLETNASSLVIAGSILAMTVNKKWAIMPAVVGSFLLQHALQGWCPPLAIIRRAKVRTSNEINQERRALLNVLEEK